MELGDLPNLHRLRPARLVWVAILAIMELGDLPHRTQYHMMFRFRRNPRYNGIG